jgi:hypothetical protein
MPSHEHPPRYETSLTELALVRNEESFPAFPCVTLSSERYEARARGCEERANSTRDLEVKQMLLSIAQQWRELAEKLRMRGD